MLTKVNILCRERRSRSAARAAVNHPDRCPPDPEEVAELFFLGMLAPEDGTAFEDHCITCPACAAVVEETDVFVRAMRAAGRELEK